MIRGLVAGAAAGLIPGLHPNNLAYFFTSSSDVAALITAYSFFSLVPSLLFSLPSSEFSSLAASSKRSLKTAVASAFFSLLLSLALSPLALWLLPLLSSSLSPFIFPFLLTASLLLIFKEKRPFYAFLIFSLAGLLGFLSFRLSEPFLPLFGGMFLFSSGLKAEDDGILHKKALLLSLLGVPLALFSMLIPGFGSPAQLSAFASVFIPLNSPAFFALSSSIALSQSVFSFAAYEALGKARVGAVAIAKPQFSQEAALSMLFSGSLSALLLLLLPKINLSSLRLFSLLYVVLFSFLFDGWMGLLVFALAAALGGLCVGLGVRRIQLLGALMLPTLWYLVAISI